MPLSATASKWKTSTGRFCPMRCDRAIAFDDYKKPRLVEERVVSLKITENGPRVVIPPAREV
eukprot:6435884-Pyramimonas_sp.AAC.1